MDFLKNAIRNLRSAQNPDIEEEGIIDQIEKMDEHLKDVQDNLEEMTLDEIDDHLQFIEDDKNKLIYDIEKNLRDIKNALPENKDFERVEQDLKDMFSTSSIQDIRASILKQKELAEQMQKKQGNAKIELAVQAGKENDEIRKEIGDIRASMTEAKEKLELAMENINIKIEEEISGESEYYEQSDSDYDSEGNYKREEDEVDSEGMPIDNMTEEERKVLEEERKVLFQEEEDNPFVKLIKINPAGSYFHAPRDEGVTVSVNQPGTVDTIFRPSVSMNVQKNDDHHALMSHKNAARKGEIITQARTWQEAIYYQLLYGYLHNRRVYAIKKSNHWDIVLGESKGRGDF